MSLTTDQLGELLQAMMEQTAAVRELIAARGSSSTPSTLPGLTAFTRPKLPDPAKFNGKSHEVQPYVASVMERLDGMGATSDATKIIYFSSFLSQGSPQQWHNSIRVTDQEMFKDWTKYVKAFEAHFSDPNEKVSYRLQLEKLEQISSVISYASKYKELAALSEIDLESKRQWYFRGLKLEIQLALNQGAGIPADFDTMVASSISLDQTLEFIHTINSPNKRKSNGSSNNYNPFTRQSESKFNGSSNSNANHTKTTTTTTDTTIPSGPWPMEVDAVRAKLINGRLPKSELARRIRLNLCAYCGGEGHVRDNCPARKSSTPSGKGTPRA
jgi:hypothetical protein